MKIDYGSCKIDFDGEKFDGNEKIIDEIFSKIYVNKKYLVRRK